MADQNNLLNRILHSVFFNSAKTKAGKAVKNPATLLHLITQVLKKSSSNPMGIVNDAQDKISLLVRMIRAYAKGQYRVLPWKSLVLTVAVLFYFVSPIDVIPDLLPIVGLTDDIALILWLYRVISKDLADFQAWEQEQVTNAETL
ncbi:MAG: DUF1232 domain-containing protein [Siphonobacter sp.]